MSVLASLDGSLLQYIPDHQELNTSSWQMLREASSQTEITYIIELKQVELGTQELLAETKMLEREVKLTKHVLNAKFESQLRARSEELKRDCENKLSKMAADYSSNVEMLRDSFRTQMRDALQVISGEYRRYYEDLTSGQGDGQAAKLRELRNDKQELNNRVVELEAQLLLACTQLTESQRLNREISSQPDTQFANIRISQEEYSNKESQEEVRELSNTVERLEEKADELQSKLNDREALNNKLEMKIEQMKKELEHERKDKQKFENEFQKYRQDSEKSNLRANERSNKTYFETEEKTKQELEEKRKDMLKQAQDGTNEARMQERAKMQVEMQKIRDELDKVRLQRDELVNQDLNTELQEALKREKQLENDMQKLNKNLIRTDKAWQVKYKILEAKLHAIKDESYIRRYFEKQATTLNRASVHYTPQDDTHVKPNYSALPCLFGPLHRSKS